MVNTIKYRYNMTITKKDDLIDRAEVLKIVEGRIKNIRDNPAKKDWDDQTVLALYSVFERIKKIQTNHKLSERGMADASSSDESNKSANNDLCKCGHNKDIHSPLAQDICLIYLGNGYACDCKHFERSNIK